MSEQHHTPKIMIPQQVPAIFEAARDEENWLIFAIGKPDEKGKRPKRPIVRDAPWIWCNRDKAASMTLDRALDRLKWIAENGDLDRWNRKAEERRQEQLAEGKKPPPSIEVESYALGYFPREGSALVALDFDNCVTDGVIVDWEIAGLIEETGAYAEISSSENGSRVFMPRAEGDEKHHAGENHDAGAFVGSKGAACAITFNVLRDGTERDQELFDLMVERRGAAPDHEAPDTGTIADQVLDHGRTEFKTFKKILPYVKNDERFDEVGDWIGMVRGAKEYYEIVDPDCLDELRELLEEWSASHPTIEHDADKFDEVWNRKTPSGTKVGLGSWKHYAKEAGWIEHEIEVSEDEEDEWGFLKTLDMELVGSGKKQVPRPIANYANATRIVQRMPLLRGLIGRNVLTGDLVRLRDWEGGSLPYPVEWTDVDMHRLLRDVQGCRKDGQAVFAHFRVEHLKMAIESAAAANEVQPIRDMLAALPKWDKRERIDTFLTDYFGVEDTPLHRAYARKFLIALIARGHATPEKLVKVDTVLTLTGMQGQNKSTFFEELAIAPRLFTDHVGEITKREARENIRGKWICEFSEGDVITRADRKALKGFLSAKSDAFRPAYGRNVQTFARSSVFVMPTNEDEVINDPTGSRRIWPVKVHKIAPLNLLRVNRLQLLAEAKAAYDAGEIWWLTPEEERWREAASVEFEVEDALEAPLAAILRNVIDGQIVTLSEIVVPLGIDPTKTGSSQGERRVRDLLKRWGWERAPRVGNRRGFRRAKSTAFPPVSEEALAAMKKGEVLPLPVTSDFEAENAK